MLTEPARERLGSIASHLPLSRARQGLADRPAAHAARHLTSVRRRTDHRWTTPRPSMSRPSRGPAVARRDALEALEGEVVECRACPRLVAWREQVGRDKRAAFRDEQYWARPVPGFG